MKVVYASRTGNVQALVESLNLEDSLHIVTGTESVDTDYILFTYTDGYGDVPYEVEIFLASHASHLKALVVSGDRSYGDAYCSIAETLSEQYGVECLYKLENSGTSVDHDNLKKILSEF